MTDKTAPRESDFIRVQGNKQYLPVPQRVQWFRGEHPDWSIITSAYEIDFASGHAIMRAEVLDETGRTIASGMKAETRKGFGDFIEKAETGAVGRALARAGYGTEDALDLEGERLADAPIEQPQGGRGAASYQALRNQLLEVAATHGWTKERIIALGREMKVDDPATEQQLRDMIARIEQPGSGSAHPAPADTPERDDARSVTPATPQASQDEGSPPATSSEPVAAPTDEELLAAAGPGAEIMPPKPGTPEYRALPNGSERAKAKAWWDARKDEPEQATLAEALGSSVESS